MNAEQNTKTESKALSARVVQIEIFRDNAKKVLAGVYWFALFV